MRHVFTMSFEKEKKIRTSLAPLAHILCMRQFDTLLKITCFCFASNMCLNKARLHPRMSSKSISTLFGSPLFISACKLAVHKQLTKDKIEPQHILSEK